MDKEITTAKITDYFNRTGQAIEKVKLPEVKYVKIHFDKAAHDFLDMAKRYYEDAKHFETEGNIVDAFAALNYAHGWLDAGARLGLFDVDGDNVLFTVDKESEGQFIAPAEVHELDETELEEDFSDSDDDEDNMVQHRENV